MCLVCKLNIRSLKLSLFYVRHTNDNTKIAVLPLILHIVCYVVIIFRKGKLCSVVVIALVYIQTQKYILTVITFVDQLYSTASKPCFWLFHYYQLWDYLLPVLHPL
jgi:hypothetical protein